MFFFQLFRAPDWNRRSIDLKKSSSNNHNHLGSPGIKISVSVIQVTEFKVSQMKLFFFCHFSRRWCFYCKIYEHSWQRFETLFFKKFSCFEFWNVNLIFIIIFDGSLLFGGVLIKEAVLTIAHWSRIKPSRSESPKIKIVIS